MGGSGTSIFPHRWWVSVVPACVGVGGVCWVGVTHCWVSETPHLMGLGACECLWPLLVVFQARFRVPVGGRVWCGLLVENWIVDASIFCSAIFL